VTPGRRCAAVPLWPQPRTFDPCAPEATFPAGRRSLRGVVPRRFDCADEAYSGRGPRSLGAPAHVLPLRPGLPITRPRHTQDARLARPRSCPARHLELRPGTGCVPMYPPRNRTNRPGRVHLLAISDRAVLDRPRADPSSCRPPIPKYVITGTSARTDTVIAALLRPGRSPKRGRLLRPARRVVGFVPSPFASTERGARAGGVGTRAVFVCDGTCGD